MAIKCTSRVYNPLTAMECPHEFVCDTDADVASLPACRAGSIALVVESGRIFMVNASGEWRPFGEA